MLFAWLGLLAATGVAILGGALGVGLSAVAPKRLEQLVHVATGALLGVTAFEILPEAKHELAWQQFLLWSLAGYALLWLVGHFVYHVCPSCAIAHMDHEDHVDSRALTLLAIALGVHCGMDGLAIIAGGVLPTKIEVGVLTGVGLHKLPEGLALALLLRGSGLSVNRAMFRVAAIESLTSIGGLLGMLFLRDTGMAWVGATFALVGGGFLYLVFNAISGATTHQMQLSARRTLAIEGLSFAATGVFLWFVGRSFG